MPTRCKGVETEFIGPRTVKELVPIINIDGPRYPVLGALWQARGGTARHDAVAWGYARACSDMGMDIIQKCEVTGVALARTARSPGVETTKGAIGCDKLGIVVAGHSGQLAEMAGFRLPIESVALQALVSEPIKPCMDVVVMANTVHGYMSQSDKGEMVIGGGTDGYNNYTQRGCFHHIEETVRALVETFPMISRLKMLRQWGGIVDMTGDRSPIISKTPAGQLLRQLRLGHRRLQGDPRLGLGDGRADGQGRARPAGRRLRPGPLPRGPLHRRKRRGGGGALMARAPHAFRSKYPGGPCGAPGYAPEARHADP